MSSSKEEQQLIEQAQKDPSAFGRLYDLYYPKIFKYAYRITGEYNTATDITSETFTKVENTEPLTMLFRALLSIQLYNKKSKLDITIRYLMWSKCYGMHGHWFLKSGGQCFRILQSMLLRQYQGQYRPITNLS